MLLVLGGTFPLDAKVFTFKELNCQCELPDSWTYQETAGDLVSAIDFSRKKTFELRVFPVERTITLDNTEFMGGVEKAFIVGGYTIQNRREVPLNGVRSHEIVFFKDEGNKSLTLCCYAILADGYCYCLKESAIDEDPDQDDEFKSILGSFRFLQPPQVHTQFSFWNIFRPPANLSDPTQVANYTAGVLLGMTLIISIGILIAVSMAYLVGIGRGPDNPVSDRDERGKSVPERSTAAVVPPPRRKIHLVLDDGQQVIYDELYVRALLLRGVLTPENLFWLEGMPEWLPLRMLPAPAPEPPPAALKPTFVHGDEEESHRWVFIHRVRLLRLWALVIDLLFFIVPILLCVLAIYLLPKPGPDERQPHFIIFFFLGLYMIVVLILQFVQVLRSRSIGKSFFKLRVVRRDSGARSGFAANMVRLATNGYFGTLPVVNYFTHGWILAGVIVYAFVDALFIFVNDRCLHDYIAGTTVIQRRRLDDGARSARGLMA